MCNLYSITTNQEAIRALFRVVNRYVGNLAPMPGVFPDYPAPMVRNTDNGPEMTLGFGPAEVTVILLKSTVLRSSTTCAVTPVPALHFEVWGAQAYACFKTIGAQRRFCAVRCGCRGKSFFG
jgi:hypothetical protein